MTEIVYPLPPDIEVIDPDTGEVFNLTGAHQLKLQEWQRAVEAVVAVKPLITEEQRLRKEVAAMFFTTPKEGTNNQPLANGWGLKYTHKLDRKVDEAALPAVQSKLREMGVNPDSLVNMKPALDTKEYRALQQLNPEATKVFEEALTIKPGSPTLELIQPKEK